VRSAPRAEWLSRSEQGFDGFVAQDEERRHRPETGRQRLVAASVADSADDVLAAEFLQIISGVAGTVLLMGFAWLRAQTRAATWGGGEAIWRGGQSDQRPRAPRALRALLRSMPPTMVLPTCEAVGSCSSSFIGDEALIDATESIGKPFPACFSIATPPSGNFSNERPQLSSRVL